MGGATKAASGADGLGASVFAALDVGGRSICDRSPGVSTLARRLSSANRGKNRKDARERPRKIRTKRRFDLQQAGCSGDDGG